MSDIFEIHMEHPSRNALDDALLDWLDVRLTVASGRPVLLTGTGDAFSAGLNLEYVEGLGPAEMGEFLRMLDRFVVRLFEYTGPTVALIEGHAIAGGCVLAQCCDYRVALDQERLRIGVNELALGACFPPAVLRLMQYRLPKRELERVLFGAELFAPRRALELGLVDEVTSDAEARAREWLGRLASHPARSYGLSKTGLRKGVLAATAEDERRFAEEIELWTSDELRGRIRAALAPRPK